jgi:hypothetical protein
LAGAIIATAANAGTIAATKPLMTGSHVLVSKPGQLSRVRTPFCAFCEVNVEMIQAANCETSAHCGLAILGRQDRNKFSDASLSRMIGEHMTGIGARKYCHNNWAMPPTESIARHKLR